MVAEEYRVGGTCVIRGCVPKKLLVYASRFRQNSRTPPAIGWTVGRAAIRLADADRQQGQGDRAARSRLCIDAAEAERRDRARRARCSRTRTRCGLASGARVTAANILIATGGAPVSRPRFPASSTSSPRTRRSICPSCRERILIQGGGYIALEFAGIFAGLGSRGDAGLSRREHPARLRRRRARFTCAPRCEKRGITMHAAATGDRGREDRAAASP